MNQVIFYIILLCHFLLVAFVIVIPFCNVKSLLLLHAIIVPFIIFHWITNNNTCALTIMEHKIREYIAGHAIPQTECFTRRLINPVYDFASDNSDYSYIIYTVTICLWCISVVKLYLLGGVAIQ